MRLTLAVAIILTPALFVGMWIGARESRHERPKRKSHNRQYQTTEYEALDYQPPEYQGNRRGGQTSPSQTPPSEEQNKEVRTPVYQDPAYQANGWDGGDSQTPHWATQNREYQVHEYPSTEYQTYDYQSSDYQENLRDHQNSYSQTPDSENHDTEVRTPEYQEPTYQANRWDHQTSHSQTPHWENEDTEVRAPDYREATYQANRRESRAPQWENRDQAWEPQLQDSPPQQSSNDRLARRFPADSYDQSRPEVARTLHPQANFSHEPIPGHPHVQRIVDGRRIQVAHNLPLPVLPKEFHQQLGSSPHDYGPVYGPQPEVYHPVDRTTDRSQADYGNRVETDAVRGTHVSMGSRAYHRPPTRESRPAPQACQDDLRYRIPSNCVESDAAAASHRAMESELSNPSQAVPANYSHVEYGEPHEEYEEYEECVDEGCFYSCTCHACSLWVLDVDVIGLRRREANRYPLIRSHVDYSVPIDIDDLDSGYKLGMRARANRDLDFGCGWSLDVGYLGVPSWSDRRAAGGYLELDGPGFDLSVNPAVFVVNYRSAMHSAEINLRKEVTCRWSWLAGLRYIRFDDDLSVSELNAPFINALQINADNNLYGLQLGGAYVIHDRGGPLRIEAGLRFGIYNNDSSSFTQSSFLGPPVHAKNKELAFTGEAEVALTYQLTRHIEVRGGYMMFGLGGVALAPDQINATDLSKSHGAVHTNSLLLDGGYLGIRCSW